MRAQVDHGAAAELLEQAPVAELGHGVIAVLIQGGLVDDVLFRPAEKVRLGPVPLGVGDGHPAEEAALADEAVDGVDVARVGAALVADLEELAGFAGGPNHGPGLVERVGHLFFAVDVESGPEASVGLFGMDPVGCGDDGRLEAFLRG